MKENGIFFSYIEKALEIEDFLQYKLKIEHEGRNWAYSDFCGTQCETSDAVSWFLNDHFCPRNNFFVVSLLCYNSPRI